MQITAPLALILGIVGSVRDQRKAPAIIAAVICAFLSIPSFFGIIRLCLTPH
jgi:ABC-type dipeptide/oligopeptide/nickel transport system permease component